ncbi:helix-turn-helix domain-containing protein [Acidobacteria bacterium AB60]|nr:helix-turn-helix domain-containing protein [Acidobacteria bacterium AB60]
MVGSLTSRRAWLCTTMDSRPSTATTARSLRLIAKDNQSRGRLQLVMAKDPGTSPGAWPRRIAFLALPGSALSDIAGPYEAFLLAAQTAQQRLSLSTPAYNVTLLGVDGESIPTLGGLSLTGARAFDTYQETPDTLLIAGEPDSLGRVSNKAALFAWLQQVAGKCRHVCSICTGIFGLAESGLLRGRAVTTHWQHAESLARLYPEIQVNPEPLFLRDGKFYTSAGCTAAMDLTLALIEEDLGPSLAADIARANLMFLRRPGRQAQISPLLKLEMSHHQPLRNLQLWMLEHLHLPLTVEDLAGQAHMSLRNFARTFVAALGVTPARFLETLRLEAARRRLEETTQGLDQIASECGFGSSETMRRAFLRNLGAPPGAYRREVGSA